jgi:uncharacterized protein
MGRPIVHFEIISRNTEKLRATSVNCSAGSSTRAPRSRETVSKPLKYGFVNGGPSSDGTGIPVGVGGARIMTVT